MPDFAKWIGMLLFVAAYGALKDCKSFGGFMHQWAFGIGAIIILLSIILPLFWAWHTYEEKYPYRARAPFYYQIYWWIKDRFKKH